MCYTNEPSRIIIIILTVIIIISSSISGIAVEVVVVLVLHRLIRARYRRSYPGCFGVISVQWEV